MYSGSKSWAPVARGPRTRTAGRHRSVERLEVRGSHGGLRQHVNASGYVNDADTAFRIVRVGGVRFPFVRDQHLRAIGVKVNISGTAPTVTPLRMRPAVFMNITEPGCCRFRASTATATMPLRTATLFAAAPYCSGMRTRLTARV